MLSELFSDPLPVGTAAPDFTLPDDSGNMVTLSALRGRDVVLVFYPADDTPGWTKQLCQFRETWTPNGAAIFGINGQSAEKHAAFRKKYDFPFPLLIDKGNKVANAYHADAVAMVKRTVYRIGPDGIIRFGQRGMPDPKEVLGQA
jgi:thioredoxin-dependent peroxiredoxin